MMASFMSYFGGRRDTKQAARDAIVGLREQLLLIEKKEEHLQKKIDEETTKARANAASNRAVATQALRRKKLHEADLDRLAGTRLQLEMQVNTLESANLNAETMNAMKHASDALKQIHNGMSVTKVDATMNSINEQREIAAEISDMISNPVNSGVDLDDDVLKEELAQLEQEALDERLLGADHVPVHVPPGATPAAKERKPRARTAEEDEDAELRALQAELAMS
ncbi:Snf7-domain-containing protein [Auriscalpium vulgare]|uniref:Snf7-domain-containing protein n=1 Tax=Auriscalpium vulgare TaxID=40419 RepID=A0ACB8S2T3_9AGAM|nr:Snf7-domain-containing protein [Auriscalpium vulgare]